VSRESALRREPGRPVPGHPRRARDLPSGGGSDLTHHLQLIDFIDRHWRLAHTAADAALVGNMINYTPGSHLLASMAGAWIRSDGLHAVYPVVAILVAIKAGLLFLIVRRMAGTRFGEPAAAASVLLLFSLRLLHRIVCPLFVPAAGGVGDLCRRDVAGARAEDDRPSLAAVALFAIAGVGVFLTWLIWIGPPALVLLVLAAPRADVPRRQRLGHLACALAPVVLTAALHAAGRAESVAIVQSGGSAFWPDVSRFGWPFLLLFVGGGLAGLWHRPALVTMILTVAIAAQTLALVAVWHLSGADSPYMALKMAHLAIYPMAALGGLALSRAGAAIARLAEPHGAGARLKTRWAEGAAWMAVAGGVAWTATTVAAMPRPAPAITEDTYRAGLWARDHSQTNCIEYLVPQDSTSYWLHLAVLGNPWHPAPSAPVPSTFIATR
jgi:hypothetical protein